MYRFNLAAVLGEAKKYGFDWLISLWVYMDDLNTEQNVIYVSLLSNLPFSFMVLPWCCTGSVYSHVYA